MNPWTRPIFDIMEEFYSPRDIDAMIHSGTIEISPLAFMRGRTFKDAFIIADEMQNSSPNQMFMLTTRLGERSRMVITGDLKQSDRGEENGLLDLLKRIEKSNQNLENIRTVQLENTDVQRSKAVSKILSLYSNKYFSDSNYPLNANGEGA
jgi:phosphate starvation-inducible PhoH-like protein